MTRTGPPFREIATVCLLNIYNDSLGIIIPVAAFLILFGTPLIILSLAPWLSGIDESMCEIGDLGRGWGDFRNGCWMWNIGMTYSLAILLFFASLLLAVFSYETWKHFQVYWNDARKHIIDIDEKKNKCD